MEPVGLAVGVVGLAGLFSVCLDAVQRFDSWKKFDDELAVLGVRVEAERLRLDRWGQAVGFKQNTTSDIESHHHFLLNDERTFAVVKQLLTVLQEVFSRKGGALFSTTTGTVDSDGHVALQDHFGISSTSKRARLKWALKDKATCIVQIEQLEVLVQKLHDLVPPYEAHGGLHRENWDAEFRDIERRIHAASRIDFRAWLLGRHTPNEIPEKALKGKSDHICRWMLVRREFLDWVSSDFSNCSTKCLWIHGPPAFGKTVLCATLLRYTVSKLTTPVVSWFFSSEDLESRRDPFVAVRSWLIQLLPEATLFDLLRSRWECSHSPVALTDDIIGAFQDVIQTISECTIVIDGLDECEPGVMADGSNSVTTFLKTIGRAVSGTKTRIMITSREEIFIREGLTNTAGATAIEYKISQQDVRPDIDEYTRVVVREKLFGRDKSMCEDLCRKMVERCEGQFLWIKLKGARLAKYKSAALLEAEIEKTPSGLDEIYGRNWDRIGAIDDLQDRERAFAMMRWVSFASRPLTVAELTAALLVDLSCKDMQLNEIPYLIDDDYVANEILTMSASLLEIHGSLSEIESTDTAAQTVHFTHFTAKQYFILRMTERMDTLMVNERLRSSVQTACNNELACKCLHYISILHVWEDPDGEVHPIYQSFRNYAAISWYKHAAASDHDEVVRRANEFFTERDSVWKLWRDWFDSQEVVEDEPHQVVDEGPLHYATHFNLIETARFLMESGKCSVNDLHLRSGFTILQRTIASGQLDMALVLLNAGADILLPGKNGYNALHAASERGELKLVETFLDRGIDVNTPDDDMETPLHIASRGGHVNAVRMLLDRGADHSAGNVRGWTPFHFASLGGKVEVIDMFLDRGIDVNTHSSDGSTSLYLASIGGHADVVQMLLDRGADRSATVEDGITALHVASTCGHLEIVQKLLAGGSSGNTYLQEKMSALFKAAADGDADAAKLLLERGDDHSAVKYKGLGLTQVAARHGHLDVLQVLLDAGFDVDTEKGLTPLHQACAGGHANVVRMLLARGANVNAMYEGLGALHVAAFYGHLSISKILLRKGLDFATAVKTPFHIVAGQNSIGMVQFLLECEATASSIIRKHPLIPFHTTVTRDHSLVAKLLLEENVSGVNVRTRRSGSTPALLAAAKGHADILQMLVNHGSDISIPDNSGFTPVHCAVHLGDAGTARFLIEHESKYLILDEDCFAAMYGNTRCDGKVEIVKFLPHAKAILEAKDDDGWTPLMYACAQQRADVVELLLDAGADLATKTSTARTPLHVASEEGVTAIVNLLVSTGADTNATDSDGWSAAFWAAAEGHADTVRLLVDAGANIHGKDKDKSTILHYAAFHGFEAIIQLLLRQMIDVNAANSVGATALHIAAEKGYLSVSKLLLENGAALEAKNEQGCTPLMLAAKNGRTEVVELCLESGADINAVDLSGHTPLIWASYQGHADNVELMLERGANKDVRDIQGRTPLLIASSMAHVEVASLLVGWDVDKEMKNHLGQTPLLSAAYHGHAAIVGLLLDGGADMETRDADGKTALLLATRWGHARVVELLLGKDGFTGERDPDARDRFGQTALSFAVRLRENHIARSLLSTGRASVLSEDQFGRTPVSWAKKLGCANMDDFFSIEQQAEGIEVQGCAEDKAAKTDRDESGTSSSLVSVDGDRTDAGRGPGQQAVEQWPYACDVCMLGVPKSMGFRTCELCLASLDSYDICGNCYDLGARCLNPEHSLKETVAESTFELAS